MSDFAGNTALMCACYKGFTDLAGFLLDEGADPDVQNGKGMTALMFAVMFGRNELVKSLVERGAEVAVIDYRGLNAYDLANQSENQAALEILSSLRIE